MHMNRITYLIYHTYIIEIIFYSRDEEPLDLLSNVLMPSARSFEDLSRLA